MVLNWVWIAFFVTACTTAVVRWWLGEAEIFTALLKALFDGARSGFEISLGLAGVMALWLGLMRVGERAGMVALLARLAGPLLRRLFPGVPQAHPAQGEHQQFADIAFVVDDQGGLRAICGFVS